MSPRCSVIVPLYNKAATVARSLDSIRGQTFGDFETVIVDDGSTDDGARKVREYLDRTQDARFRYVKQQNAGPGAARNRGVEQTTAEILAFLDADDEWLPRHLELGCGVLEREPEVAAVCTLWFEEPKGHKSGQDTLRDTGITEGILRITAQTPLETLLGLMNLMTPPTIVMRRKVFDAYGGYLEEGCKFAEDSFLFLKMVLHHPVMFLTQETAVFHRDASQLSGNYRGMRPVEPFLEDPESVRRDCPPELRSLLERFLAVRAMKTASVMAYWGQWRRGQQLKGRFSAPEKWRLPWFLPSLVACSPVGSGLGYLHRRLRA